MKKLTIVAIVSLSLLMIINVSFAAENDTLILDDADNGQVIANTTDYYFDVNAASDGNGSVDNPYKNFTDVRLKENSTVHLASGEYVFEKSREFTNISFYGVNAQSTVLNGNGTTLTVKGIVNFKNVTLTNFNIINKNTLNASDTVFTGLIASSVDLYGNNYGGAIYAPSNNNTFLDNCTFFNNSAEYGGAIYVCGGNLTILNSLFYNNVAYNYGGAIAGESRVRIIINNTRFFNVSSTSDAGGSIYLVSSSLRASNLNISNSSATFGAAITSIKSDLDLTNLILRDNIARYEGGAIYQIYGSIMLNSSKFINNSARNGGGLFIDDVKVYNITSNEFTRNTASNYAGAIYSLLSDSNLTSNSFTDNCAYLFNDTYDTSGINLTLGNGNYTMYVFNQTLNSTLPSYYDLRNYGYVTSVKDQQNGGNCWAFAALASLESCILKASGEVLDLSEENMKNLMALYSDYGFKFTPNDGGNNNMVVAYLASWLGPVGESEDMYDDKSHISPVLNSLMHVQNVLYLKRNNYTDNEAIKHAIINYGAVGTSMYYEIARVVDGKIYHYYTGGEDADHAVAIVGWDDSFYIPNAPGKGAWIVKNSWGTSWLQNYNTGGYFYVSYYDTVFAKPGTYSSYTFILNDTKHFDKNYQHEISGPTDYFWVKQNHISYENAFYATGDEFLEAVSTYFIKDTDWEINIYVNSILQLVQRGFSSYGYYTINLDYPVPLMNGDLFEVVFNLRFDGDAGFPISEYVSLNKLTYSPKISFVSYDNGRSWFDLYDLEWNGYPNHRYNGQVACIKAFTQSTILNATIADLNITYDSFDLFNITAKLFDENNNRVRNGNVTFTLNGVDYTVGVYNGFAFIQLPFVLGINNISLAFNSPNYYSAFKNTTFEVSPISLDMDMAVIQDFNNAYVNFITSQSINETLLISINNQNTSVSLVNGTYRLNLTGLDYGEYVIEAVVDSDYYLSRNSTRFFVDVKKTYLKLYNLTTVYNSGDFLTIELFDEFGESLVNCPVEFTLNNVTYYNLTDDKGRIIVPVNLAVGNYTLDAVFKGDAVHVNSSNSSKITVNPLNTTLSIVGIVYDSFDLFNITVRLLDHFGREVSNGTLVVTVNDADCEFDVGGSIFKVQRHLLVGKNNLSVFFNGDNYISSNLTLSFDVSPVELGLDISVLKDFNNAYVNFTVSQLINETLLININNKNTSVGLVNGTYQLNLTGLEYGEYFIAAKIVSDFYTCENSTSFMINVKKTYIQVNDLTTTYNSGEFFKIKLLDEFGQPVVNREVKFSIDNKGYYTDENGTVLIPIALKDSVYVALITFDGDELYIKSQNSSTITVKSTIKLPEIKDYVLNSNYEVYLLNRDGNPLKNAVVTFTFNNREYNVLSDENGKATFTVPVSSGSYDIEVLNPVSLEILSQKINVLNRITENGDISAYYGYNPIYKIRVRNDDAKYASGLEVKITVNNKVYYIKSDNNGYVSLKINLNAGNYVITSEYKGFKVSNKITIKATLITKNIKAKKAKAVKYTAKLLDKNGKVLKNKKITFKIKGKTYKAKTNKKGIAKIKIRNLKVGKFTIITKYAKLQNKNTITVRR